MCFWWVNGSLMEVVFVVFDSYECVGLLVLGDFAVLTIAMGYDYGCFVVYAVNGVSHV